MGTPLGGIFGEDIVNGANPVAGALGDIGGAGLSSLLIPGLAGYIGAKENREATERMNEQNLGLAREQFDFQKYAVEDSLGIKIRNGIKNGLHPLAAIGAAPGGNISPVGASQIPTESELGNLASVGQDFSRAIMAQQTTEEKMLTALTLENMGLQNDYVRAQTMRLEQEMRNQPSHPGTASFMPGQANGLAVVEKPLERTATVPGSPHMVSGAIPGLMYEVTPTGLAPVPSGDAKNAIEDSPYELRHFYNYGILPNVGDTKSKPPASALPKGARDWSWSVGKQEWQAQYGAGDIPNNYRTNDVMNYFNKHDPARGYYFKKGGK